MGINFQSMALQFQAVDLRDEIAKYEMENRPFPPRSGSVSKPRPSTEPETDWVHGKLAKIGAGKPIVYRFDFAEFARQIKDAH